MIYPLAFGFANFECTKSWTWFLKKLRKGIQNPDCVTLVSDRHNGIFNAIEAIFPNAAHGICVYHLAQNLKRFCKQRDDVMWLYYCAAYAYRIEDFDHFMGEVKETCPKGLVASFNADGDGVGDGDEDNDGLLLILPLSISEQSFCDGDEGNDDLHGNNDLLHLLPLTLGFLVVVVTVRIRTEHSFCGILEVSLVEYGIDDPIFVQKLCGTLFSVYADNGMFEDAIGVFDYMEKSRFKIHDKSCMVLLLALKRCDKMDMCFSFFRRMVGANVDITVHSMMTVIDGLCKGGEVERAKDLMGKWNGERGVTPNNVTYNALIDAYCKKGNLEEAKQLFEGMEKKGVRPNTFTYNILINGNCKKENFEEAKRLLEKMEKYRVRPDTVIYNVLIDMYCKKRKTEESRKLIGHMEAKGVRHDIFTYNALIDGNCKKGNFEKAKWLLVEMEKHGVRPNTITYNILIDMYCKKGKTEEAHKLIGHMEANGVRPDIVTYNALIDGNCKKRNFEEATSGYW
ncbi:hypothetical protein LWI29_028620 [Acer saccharum]|uniref:MULE transposase domain-containing protein n=1 Tax=Acer saccharum TaxID=4024 RepID=A0AA39RMV3_ACESA|nr:hypothetical protein LWI29_028620 [Acer saccharum]